MSEPSAEGGRRSSSNIAKFYVYALLFWLVFWQPIIVLFWTDHGVSLAQIFWLKSAHGLTLLLAQLPSGACADRFGKRTALLLGTSVSSASLIVYLVGDGFWVFLVAELLAAVATSLVAAADSALLHDMLRDLDRQTEFTDIMGKAGSLRFAAQGAGGILGGLAAGASYRLTFALTLITTVASVAVISTMREPIRRRPRESPVAATRVLRDAMGLFRTSAALRALALYMALLVSIDLIVLWSYQPYLQSAGIPVALFGFAYMLFNLTAATASRFAARTERRIGANALLVVLPLVVVISVLLLGTFSGVWAILFIAPLQLVRGMRVAVVHRRILDGAESEKATVLAVVNLLSRLIFFIGAPIFGWAAEHHGLPDALKALAIVWSVLFLLGAAARR